MRAARGENRGAPRAPRSRLRRATGLDADVRVRAVVVVEILIGILIVAVVVVVVVVVTGEGLPGGDGAGFEVELGAEGGLVVAQGKKKS